MRIALVMGETILETVIYSDRYRCFHECYSWIEEQNRPYYLSSSYMILRSIPFSYQFVVRLRRKLWCRLIPKTSENLKRLMTNLKMGTPTDITLCLQRFTAQLHSPKNAQSLSNLVSSYPAIPGLLDHVCLKQFAPELADKKLILLSPQSSPRAPATMFTNALKSFSSNISANYTVSATPSTSSGAWKVYDAKKKSTGKAVSVFVFERKSLDPQSGGLGGRSGGSALRKLHDEVIARVKKESNALARLRHPSILELAEPIEETRNGGLMFATEPVTASLAGLLREKDDQEIAGGGGGRPSRFVVEEADGQKRKRELEIDELEIQKGLLQVAQGLDFLHESAGLVHGNLTPEAIYINAKVCVIGSYLPQETCAPVHKCCQFGDIRSYQPHLSRLTRTLVYFSPLLLILDARYIS